MPDAGTPTAPAGARPRRRFTVDDLFVDSRPQAVGVVDLPTAKEIRLDRIVADPDQPRRTFDEGKLAELAASIRREGVLQPIAVRYDAAADRYVILHGERRWRAAGMVGLAAIPAVVREVPVERRLVQQLMENIVRDDLNPVDRATALRALKAQLGDAPWETVAETVGIRRSRLFQLLGTEKLPEAARDDLRAGRLNEKQSRALHGLPPAHQEALRELIVAEDIPAAEALRLARELREAALPDEPGVVKDALIELRREGRHPNGATPAIAVLERITVGAVGRPGELAPLDVSDVGTAGFADRVESQVLALAETLARMPAGGVDPGGATHRTLRALVRAVEALLRPRTG